TVASSRVWETDPVGGPTGQPPYLNAVVRAETALSAQGVLAAANRVEAALGRTREGRWGPRTIDIDVLLYDDLRQDDPELTIPHPRMPERACVVPPLLDIDPAPVLPDGPHVLEVAVETDGAGPVEPPLALP